MFINFFYTLRDRGIPVTPTSFIRRNEKKPFFLYLPLPSPHFPIVPSKEWQGKTKAGAYGDFVVQTDDSCGQILNALTPYGGPRLFDLSLKFHLRSTYHTQLITMNIPNNFAVISDR